MENTFEYMSGSFFALEERRNALSDAEMKAMEAERLVQSNAHKIGQLESRKMQAAHGLEEAGKHLNKAKRKGLRKVFNRGKYEQKVEKWTYNCSKEEGELEKLAQQIAAEKEGQAQAQQRLNQAKQTLEEKNSIDEQIKSILEQAFQGFSGDMSENQSENRRNLLRDQYEKSLSMANDPKKALVHLTNAFEIMQEAHEKLKTALKMNTYDLLSSNREREMYGPPGQLSRPQPMGPGYMGQPGISGGQGISFGANFGAQGMNLGTPGYSGYGGYGMPISGGGMFDDTNMISAYTSLKTNEKMKAAQSLLQQANEEFTRALEFNPNLPEARAVTVGLSDLLSFANVLYDNMLTDLMVRSKVKEALRAADDALRRCEAAYRFQMSCCERADEEINQKKLALEQAEKELESERVRLMHQWQFKNQTNGAPPSVPPSVIAC